MLDRLAETLSYGIPWWIWAAPTVAGAAGLFLAVSKVVGWRNAAVAVAGYLAVAVALLSRLRGRQEGWEARVKKDTRDAEKLVERIKKARRDAAARQPDRLRDDDGFKRP